MDIFMGDRVDLICVTDKFPKFLTNGAKYNAVKHGSYYAVINDANQARRYKEEYFMTIDQYREKVLTEIGI